jgi:hypothetical protein
LRSAINWRIVVESGIEVRKDEKIDWRLAFELGLPTCDSTEEVI